MSANITLNWWSLFETFNRTVQYGSGNLPHMIKTSAAYLLYNIFENNINQNYGAGIGFHFIALKEVPVVILMFCDVKTFSHNTTFSGF